MEFNDELKFTLTKKRVLNWVRLSLNLHFILNPETWFVFCFLLLPILEWKFAFKEMSYNGCSVRNYKWRWREILSQIRLVWSSHSHCGPFCIVHQLQNSNSNLFHVSPTSVTSVTTTPESKWVGETDQCHQCQPFMSPISHSSSRGVICDPKSKYQKITFIKIPNGRVPLFIFHTYWTHILALCRQCHCQIVIDQGRLTWVALLCL